jgi:hypothetical protein
MTMNALESPLTAEKLRAIGERCDLATAGPWRLIPTGSILDAAGRLVGRCDYNPDLGKLAHRDNAEFLAHAQQDVEELLAEVQRLRALLGEER